MLIQRYKEMVDELHCQPREEVIMGSFLDKNASIDGIKNDPPKPKKKKNQHEKDRQ